MTMSQLDWKLIKPEIGAELFADKADLLSGRHATEIRQQLEDRGVLVLPEIDFSEEELIAFTRSLGKYAPDRPDERATRINLDKNQGASAEYIKGSFFWHFDGYNNDQPILASILCCLQPSPTGGNTEFANTYAAYEALPEDRKEQLKGLCAVHALAGAQLAVEPEPSYERFCEWLQVHHKTLPLVWKHRSGRQSLVIGNTAVNILDVNPLDGLKLLVWLRDWATRERFCYSHHWRAGDAVIWDNTGTLHRATPYPADCGRAMMRTKLAGEETWA